MCWKRRSCWMKGKMGEEVEEVKEVKEVEESPSVLEEEILLDEG